MRKGFLFLSIFARKLDARKRGNTAFATSCEEDRSMMSQQEILLGDGMLDLIILSHGSENQGVDLGLEPEDGIHREASAEQFAAYELARMNGQINEDPAAEAIELLESGGIVPSDEQLRILAEELSIETEELSVENEPKRRRRKVRGKPIVRVTSEINEIL